MYRLSAALLLVLWGCTATEPLQPQGNFRPATAQMYSSAVLDPARLAGRWQQVAAFGPEGACRPGGVEIKPDLRATWRLCLSGVESKGSARMVATGPGRFEVAGQAWWVLWADTDYRTLVIGTPSGAFGFILNRETRLPPDRLTAAREILDWNGYDLSRLQVFNR